jgi:hypothetical protein
MAERHVRAIIISPGIASATMVELSIAGFGMSRYLIRWKERSPSGRREDEWEGAGRRFYCIDGRVLKLGEQEPAVGAADHPDRQEAVKQTVTEAPG